MDRHVNQPAISHFVPTIRESSCVRRPGGALRHPPLPERADDARLGRESRRLAPQRLPRAAAAFMLLLAALAFAAPATMAQTSVTLVSNTGQTAATGGVLIDAIQPRRSPRATMATATS